MKKYLILLIVVLVCGAVTATISCSKIDELKEAASDAAGSQLIIAVLVSNGSEVKTFAEESGGKDLSVSIQGENKALVKGTMQSGISLGTYILNTDIIKPSEEDPLQFTLVFSAEGYLTTSRTYYFAGNQTKYDYVILTNLSAVNAGVDSTTVTSGSAANGVVAAAVTVATAKNRASVLIPQGVTLTAEDGTPLNGALTTTIAHFDAGDPRSLAAFPGSLDPVVTDENGDTRPVNFTSAGFLSLDIADASGNKASTITGGSLGIEIAASGTTNNPETGEIIKAGDSIPFWSFDEKTGEWTYEKSVTVEQSDFYIPGTRTAQSGLKVATTITHLSSYNLDYHEDACAISAKINLTNKAKDKAVQLDVKVDGEYVPQRVVVNDDFIQFNNPPKGKQVTIQVATDVEQTEEFDPLTEIIKMVKTIIDPPDFVEDLDALVIDDLCDKTKQHSLDVSKYFK